MRKRTVFHIVILAGFLVVVAASGVLCHQGFCVFYLGFDEGLSEEVAERGTLIMKLSLVPMVGALVIIAGAYILNRKEKQKPEP